MGVCKIVDNAVAFPNFAKDDIYEYCFAKAVVLKILILSQKRERFHGKKLGSIYIYQRDAKKMHFHLHARFGAYKSFDA